MSVIRLGNRARTRKGTAQKAAMAKPRPQEPATVRGPLRRSRSGREATTATAVVITCDRAARARIAAGPTVKPRPSRMLRISMPR